VRTLAWLTLQFTTIAAVIWSEIDSARLSHREPDLVTASIVGVVAALFMTALVAAGRDLFMRWLSPRHHAGPTLDPRTAIGHDGQASSEGERLIASPGSRDDSPKLISNRRIG
jgi:hypothetical protein